MPLTVHRDRYRHLIPDRTAEPFPATDATDRTSEPLPTSIPDRTSEPLLNS